MSKKKVKKKLLNNIENKVKNNFNDLKNNLPTFKENPNKEIFLYKEKDRPAEKFLDKKRIILFALMAIFAIILIIVTVTFITDVNVDEIIRTSAEIQQHTGAILAGWLLLLILTSFIRLIWQIESIRFRLKYYLIKVKVREWWCFGIITLFINTITIFAIGSDPYKLWWMTKKGLKLYQANAILLSTGWIIQLSQMILSYPSLGYLIYLYFFSNNEFTHSVSTNISMILVCIGYCNDILVFITLTILAYNLRLQFLIVRIFNWIRKKIGLTFKSKDVLKDEFIQKNKFQNEFKKHIRSFEANCYIIFWTLVALIMYYFSMFFSIELVVPYVPSERIHILANTFWNTYNFANVASVANNFIPIPGGEGTIQFVLISFFNSSTTSINTGGLDLNTTIKQTVFIWRVFNYYLIIIFGAIFLICLAIFKYIKNRIIKKEKIKNSWFEIHN